MPLSTEGFCRWLAIAVFVPYAISAEERDDLEFSGVKGQQHVSIDPQRACAIEVVVLRSDNGAEIYGDNKGDGHVSFRVFVRPDGGVEVNGEQLAACDPTRGCRLSIVWCPDSGTIVAQVADATGAVRAGQYALARPPDEIHVTAAEILSLVVMR